MEQYGIFYFFKHEDGKHTMVLGDDVSAYVDIKEKDVSRRRNITGNLDMITGWEHQVEYRPGKWTHHDYNFNDFYNDDDYHNQSDIDIYIIIIIIIIIKYCGGVWEFMRSVDTGSERERTP